MENSRSTYMLDAHAELSVLVAALSEESRMKVMAFFDRKMSLSYRNGRKAGPPGNCAEAGHCFGSEHGEGIALSVSEVALQRAAVFMSLPATPAARVKCGSNFSSPPRMYVHFVIYIHNETLIPSYIYNARCRLAHVAVSSINSPDALRALLYGVGRFSLSIPRPAPGRVLPAARALDVSGCRPTAVNPLRRAVGV
jgi:hypothetical protein